MSLGGNGGTKHANQTLIQFTQQGDLLRSSAQEINTRFSRDGKNTNLFVERLVKDKDTDKNVDADHDRTGRPVGGHWSSVVDTRSSRRG